MSIGNKTVYKRITFTLLAVICIGFIFSHSLLPGDKSGNESGKVLELLNSIAEFFGIGSIFTHNFVRKCAHFSEFTILSIMIFNMYKAYRISTKNVIVASVLSCTLVAVVDELIQYFVPGRACQFTDVLIDCSGGIFGLALSLIIFLLFNKNKRNC